MAKFEPQQILKLILKNTEYGVIAFLIFVALIMSIFLGARSEYRIPDATLIDISKIRFPKDAIADIKGALENLKPFEQSTYQKDLLQRNLFSFREVISKQAVEKEIADKLKRAQTLFDQANYQECINLCDEILGADPNREPALELKNKAQKALQPVPTPTPATR